MSLRTFSSFPSRTIAAVSRPACRFNSTNSAPSDNATNALQNIIKPSAPKRAPARLRSRHQALYQQNYIEQQRIQSENRAMEKYQTRDWKAGDVYAPHDLSPAEMKKWKKRSTPTSDAFDALNLNPLHLYKNFSIMSSYMTDMGRIKHRNVTGLRGVNQRKLAKAIRRAIGTGLMPSVHRHPEILAELKSREPGAF
ncbi:mitochondrial 37S ribosomal protein bS18m [Aspergillus stella-maris]|uniref:mitochondrial 37S ribosomal protein bS18m n=1 Tax=Aspergillus stella-maris TaxID=1810926 RepID=UPI003CCCA7B5